MKDILFKLNMVKNHNQIVKLKKQNKNNTDKTLELMNSYKKIMGDYQAKTKNEISRMKVRMDELEKENDKLNAQCEFYKDCFNKIPHFILRIFIGKNRKLLDK